VNRRHRNPCHTVQRASWLWWLVIASSIGLSPLSRAADFQIDPENSYIHVITDKSGALKGLAHNHVVSLLPLAGMVSFESINTASVSLTFKPTLFTVDTPENMAMYPDIWEKTVSENAVVGTKENMLGKKLLYAEKYPNVNVVLTLHSLTGNDALFNANIQLKNNNLNLRIPGQLSVTDSRLSAQADFELTNEQLKLEPFKAMGGAMVVGKRLRFVVVINAKVL
jgi:hypothetical protein